MGAMVDEAILLISEYIGYKSMFWFCLYGMTLGISLWFVFKSLYLRRRRAMETTHFMIFCIPIAVWASVTLIPAVISVSGNTALTMDLINKSALLVIPTFLCMHVWSHVSYKPITGKVWSVYLLVPALVIVIWIAKAVNPSLETAISSSGLAIEWLLSGIAYGMALVKSYLLCFNVFYQMPKHMRSSTYNTLWAISIISIAKIIALVFRLPQLYAMEFNTIAYIVAICTVMRSFYFASSSNVIVTSREFVFNSLSTIVLTVSRKGNILDWNKKKADKSFAIPAPKYKESYINYRKRIITECNGHVSQHDENIITTTVNGQEKQLLFTKHDIGFSGRHFGYLIEISEVTTLYSVLRYMEEIAMVDQLTGLNNRNAYMTKVKQLISEGELPFVIVVGDINNLKKYNDTAGHLVGDNLITTISSTIIDSKPENSFCYRIGGDELVVLIPHSSIAAAEKFEAIVADKLNAIDTPGFGHPSISFGHAIMSSAGEDYNAVFFKADAMMYENKIKLREMTLSGLVPKPNMQKLTPVGTPPAQTPPSLT